MMKKHYAKHEPTNNKSPESRIKIMRNEINSLKTVLDKQMILNSIQDFDNEDLRRIN